MQGFCIVIHQVATRYIAITKHSGKSWCTKQQHVNVWH